MFARKTTRAWLGAGLILAFPMIVDCGNMKGIPGAPAFPGVPGGCPADIADASAIMNANFGLKGELEGKAKGALAAGADLQKIGADVEAEVTTACSNLAKDLGASDADLKPKEEGPGKKAEAACAAAVKIIGEVKAKAGVKYKLDVKPPVCNASVNAMADCAGKCDATCDGKCDGKNTKGKCAGTCDGKCTGKADAVCKAECKGECNATCSVKANGKCEGTCSGGCSVEFKEPKCSGEVKPPEMSAEC